MNKTFKLKPPMMPNFIIIDTGLTAQKQGEFQESPKIPVSELTKEEAEQYADLMKSTFMWHWKNKTQNK